MIDFLKFSTDKKKCECVGFSAHSIQLLPQQYEPYVFYIGFEGKPLEYIYIIDSYGNLHEMNYADVTFVNGYLSIKNIQFDDVNDVVFKLIINDNEIYYSIPIKISSYNSCKTTRVTFSCNYYGDKQSISFPIWFKQNNRNTELTTAYDIATKSTISYATSNAKFMTYQTDFMNVDTLCDLNDALLSTYVYFNNLRVSLFEAVEISETEADAEFIEAQIKVNEYKGLNGGGVPDDPMQGTLEDLNNGENMNGYLWSPFVLNEWLDSNIGAQTSIFYTISQSNLVGDSIILDLEYKILNEGLINAYYNGVKIPNSAITFNVDMNKVYINQQGIATPIKVGKQIELVYIKEI